MLPRFQQDDEGLPWHGTCYHGTCYRGVCYLARQQAVRRSECHLVLGRLVQGNRDEAGLGSHRPLSPEDLHRPPDLGCVQGIERKAVPLVLVGSGGVGRSVSPLLRLAAVPGAEALMPLLADALPLAFPPVSRRRPGLRRRSA